MLRITNDVLWVIRMLRGTLRRIERRDLDLGRQLRRALASVALNLEEGSGVRGGNRRVHYERAHGSAREVWVALHVAMAFGYIDDVDEAVLDRWVKVGFTARKLAKR